jgi:hypothetical protein
MDADLCTTKHHTKTIRESLTMFIVCRWYIIHTQTWHTANQGPQTNPGSLWAAIRNEDEPTKVRIAYHPHGYKPGATAGRRNWLQSNKFSLSIPRHAAIQQKLKKKRALPANHKQRQKQIVRLESSIVISMRKNDLNELNTILSTDILHVHFPTTDMGNKGTRLSKKKISLAWT